jgi:hypothetical protein
MSKGGNALDRRKGISARDFAKNGRLTTGPANQELLGEAVNPLNGRIEVG